MDVPPNDGGMPILDFQIKFKAIGGPLDWYGYITYNLKNELDHSYIKPRILLTGLVGNTQYDVQIFSRSIVGLSTPYLFSIRTKSNTHPGPVKVCFCSVLF